MFGFFVRWFKRTVLALIVLLVLLLLPSAYVELFCTSEVKHASYDPIITEPEYQRTEANSFLTYPEWHIVYAYEGLAHVLENGDEHEFDYSASIAGFWRSACSLNRTSQEHGEADFVTRGIIHVIGVSFTLELGLKAVYEETLGRLFAMIRGPVKTPQDDYARWMARDFSNFLQQTPWYDYDFHTATTDLWNKPVKSVLRGWERRLALGGEWKAKAAYASLIADASNAAGAVVLRIRLVVDGIEPSALAAVEGVKLIKRTSAGLTIEADRYRKLTIAMADIVNRGGRIIEIAGNDDVLVTAIRPALQDGVALKAGTVIADIRRDGYTDNRLLISIKVSKFAELYNELQTNGITLEHVYDY